MGAPTADIFSCPPPQPSWRMKAGMGHRAGIPVFTHTPGPARLMGDLIGRPPAGFQARPTQIRASPAPHAACERIRWDPFAQARYARMGVHTGCVVLYRPCRAPHNQWLVAGKQVGPKNGLPENPGRMAGMGPCGEKLHEKTPAEAGQSSAIGKGVMRCRRQRLKRRPNKKNPARPCHGGRERGGMFIS